MEKDFVDIYKEGIEYLGFWTEESYQFVKKCIEMQYKKEIIENYFVEKIELVRDGVLIKWKKRINPLSKTELSEKQDM